ncbi:MAG: hypothetical protein IAF08_11155 [Rhizobacter sp.]|nr:hypothetical protein [Chlorobiales bacterium]
MRVDFAAAWDWEYDAEFIALLKAAAAAHRISFLDITLHNLNEVLHTLATGELFIACLLDRASDGNEQFLPLQHWATAHRITLVNSYHAARWSLDKATMHLELMTAGIELPYTVMLSAYNDRQMLLAEEIAAIAALPKPFVIKPTLGGGGVGVVKSAYTLAEVLHYRTEFAAEKYLVQEKVYPKYSYGWRCWFRAYYFFGETLAVWWDDETHIYREISESDYDALGLDAMSNMIRRIASCTGMQFFSSEITLTREGRFVAVDYVNDQIDLRPKSTHLDGVPDTLVRLAAEKLIAIAATSHPTGANTAS